MAEKKKFHEVEIPLLNETIYLLGKTKKDTANKTVLLDLTRRLRGKSTELKLKTREDGDKIIAEPSQLRILPFYIRRVMRKGVSYIEDSFQIEIKDAKITVKPLLITRKKVSRAVRKALRDKARETLLGELSQQNTEQIFSDLLNNNLQKFLSLRLKKIYPLGFTDIRILKVDEKLESKKIKKEKVKQETEKPEEKAE